MIAAQEIPCDVCGRLVTFITTAPRCIEEVDTAAGEIACTVAPLALAWAETDFSCGRCASARLHPSMHRYLNRFH